MPARYDYLMIGNSAAAISAIEAIRSLDSDGTIAVISPEEHPAYSTPMISYLLKGATDISKMPIREAGFYESNRVDCLLGSAAVSIDAKVRTVELESGAEVGYGKLLIACGSAPAPAPVEGLEGQNVFPFLNLTDALAVRSCIEEARAARSGNPVRAVVIGSGLIGCKACEGISALADEVTMLARSPEILRSVLAAEASPIAERALKDAGIDVRLSTQAISFTKKDGKVVSLGLSDGTEIPCDLVILAAGVRPNDSIAKEAGAKVDRGIVCDDHMRTTLPDIYAAGDVAVTHDRIEGSDRVIALWPSAVEEGRIAGLNMAGLDTVIEGEFPMNSITLFGTTILSAGVNRLGEGMEEIRSVETPSEFSRFVIRNDELVGFTVVNRPEGAGIYTRIIRDRIPVSKLSSEIFERVPQMRDLPREVMEASMHEGMM